MWHGMRAMQVDGAAACCCVGLRVMHNKTKLVLSMSDENRRAVNVSYEVFYARCAI